MTANSEALGKCPVLLILNGGSDSVNIIVSSQNFKYTFLKSLSNGFTRRSLSATISLL